MIIDWDRVIIVGWLIAAPTALVGIGVGIGRFTSEPAHVKSVGAEQDASLGRSEDNHADASPSWPPSWTPTDFDEYVASYGWKNDSPPSSLVGDLLRRFPWAGPTPSSSATIIYYSGGSGSAGAGGSISYTTSCPPPVVEQRSMSSNGYP